MSGILGKKIGMTQIFEDGKFVPVTVVEAGPNFVLQKKTEEKDGYVALQLGFDEKKEKNTTKPLMGIFNKAGVKPQRFVKELAVESVDGYELGQEIKVDVLAEVEYVDITGTSKGKGTSSKFDFKDGEEVSLLETTETFQKLFSKAFSKSISNSLGKYWISTVFSSFVIGLASCTN